MIAYTDIPKQLLVNNDVDGFFKGVRDQFIKEVDGKLPRIRKHLRMQQSTSPSHAAVS